MSALQTFLRSGGTLADLLATRAIKHARHPDHPSLVLFKYDQINSPMGDPVVQAARGPILDESRDWAFVSRPFDKFFNHGEGHAAPIDWPTARVQEKVDGSLCVLYHHAGKWHVATTGTPNAGGQVNGCGFTFADLFWRTFDAMGLLRPAQYDCSFMFELSSPWNRIVVRYPEPRLTLLAVRSVEGFYIEPERFAFLYPVVRSFPLGSFDEALATFAHMDPLKQEGYVVVDGRGNRVKVKHPGYVAIHHMRDGFGPRRVLEVIRSGETSELLTHFPEWRPEFERLQAAFDSMAGQIDADFARLRGIAEQKAFALEAVKTPCSAALFQMRKGSVPSARAYLAAMHIDRLMDLLRVKDEPQQEAA
jgi:hypothetical protein